ncbi:MAG: methyltransferase domain-containing protein [Pirellulaceae bacterium]
MTEQPENQLGQFIPVHYHYDMLRDRYRMSAFEEAISEVAKVGSRVVDLGGGTGVLSFFAARRGAKVWYVERNPELVEVARRFLELNDVSKRVTIIRSDAATFVPPEPVDVVVCEMLHSALVREKQVQVIDAFKQNYRRAHTGPLPSFIPEASLLAIQPVQQDYEFSGYYAPVPLFQAPVASLAETEALGEPIVYQTVIYDQALPDKIGWRGQLQIDQKGILNAIRFVTKNVLTILPDENRDIPWHNQYLVVPLEQPIEVHVGDQLDIQFRYSVGGSLAELQSQLQVTSRRSFLKLHAAA